MTPSNRIKTRRTACNWTATALAAELGISRQTVHAIEAGQYIPNTTIALRLARLLDTTVEDLFGASGEPATGTQRTRATLLKPVHRGAASGSVQAWRMDGEWFATRTPRYPSYLPVADRLVGSARGRRILVDVRAGRTAAREVVIAGCDPALSLLSSALSARGIATELVPVPSRTALQWLKDDRVHIAGTHLRDPETGDYNLPIVSRMFADQPTRVTTYAQWAEGFVVRPGNPHRIRSAADLVGRVRMVNREAGAGARALLDADIAAAGISHTDITGYDTVAESPFAAAAIVSSGGADCCVASAAVAEWFGLTFVPIQVARFDLVMRRDRLDDRARDAVMDALGDGRLRRSLSAIAGYETQHTGRTRTHGTA